MAAAPDEPTVNQSGQYLARSRKVSAPVLVYFFSAVSLVLFIAGFIAGEDAFAGKVRADLYLFHGPTMLAFHTKPFLSVLADYSSATTPLFHILESFNPLLGHDLAFRATFALFALAVCGLFIYAIRRRFADNRAARLSSILIGSSILLSPYFRGESYWVTTDVFPVFLVVLTALLLDPVQDRQPDSRPSGNPWLLVPLVAVVSWACFYCRQTDLFLPFYALLVLVWSFRRHLWWTLCWFAVLGLPAVYLLHLWKGLTPPSFRHHQGFSPYAIVPPLSMVLIYAVPFLLERILQTGKNITLFTKSTGSSWLFGIAGWVTFLGLFHGFRFNDRNEGGGIASRLLAGHGAPGRYLFLTLSYCGFLIALHLCRRASWKGWVLLVSFFLPAFVMTVFFQRYYDPLLVVMFFLLWEKSTVAPFLTVRTGAILTAFNAVLLVGALTYNGRTKPVFMPIASHPQPWTEIVPY